MHRLFLLLIPALAPGAAIYNLTDLGTLGGASAAAHAISNTGQVVGSATDAPATCMPRDSGPAPCPKPSGFSKAWHGA